MEKLREGEFDTLNTQEAAGVATGLVKEQNQKKSTFTLSTHETHISIFLQEIYTTYCILNTLESTSKFF